MLKKRMGKTRPGPINGLLKSAAVKQYGVVPLKSSSAAEEVLSMVDWLESIKTG